MSSLQSLRCVASKENAQMMLKDKMSIISASGRPTAKLNPFLESSFRGHCTVANAGLEEAMNVGQKSEQFSLFFKRNKRPAIACFHIALEFSLNKKFFSTNLFLSFLRFPRKVSGYGIE